MNKAYFPENNSLTEGTLMQALPFLAEGRHVVALVGGGGKSTLMNTLARLLCGLGRRVAVTTTTHIYRPADRPLCRSIGDCRRRWEQGEIALWCRTTDDGKLRSLTGEEFAALTEADIVLVEADGAKRLPCKVPADYEPVIPEQTDLVLGVMGMDACGEPVQDICFRREETLALLGCEGSHRLTPQDMAAILLSESGTRKGVGDRRFAAVLNKADSPERLAAAEIILRLLQEKGQSGIATCLKGEPR